jgi:hypothetical protein
VISDKLINDKNVEELTLFVREWEGGKMCVLPTNPHFPHTFILYTLKTSFPLTRDDTRVHMIMMDMYGLWIDKTRGIKKTAAAVDHGIFHHRRHHQFSQFLASMACFSTNTLIS